MNQSLCALLITVSFLSISWSNPEPVPPVIGVRYLTCSCDSFGKVPSQDRVPSRERNFKNMVLGYIISGDYFSLTGYSNKSQDPNKDMYDPAPNITFSVDNTDQFQLPDNVFMGSYVLSNKVINELQKKCKTKNAAGVDYAYINLAPTLIPGANGALSYIKWKFYISPTPAFQGSASKNGSFFIPLSDLGDATGDEINPIPPGMFNQ